MKKPLLFITFVFCFLTARSQYYQQYFDGADTAAWNSVLFQFDTSSSNVWQVGRPQKTIFNSASTVPNALVTDTTNFYPPNNVSRCWFTYDPQLQMYGVLAVQWRQKIDLDPDHDGGVLEFSMDHGQTWLNAFNNPYVYNFYGYDPQNLDTLVTGEYAFSGRDTNWRDIWFCLDYSMVQMLDTVDIRFTLISDSVDNQREGWMIDNVYAHPTIMHTMKDGEQKDYLKIFPTITSGIVNIQLQKLMEFHIINKIDVIDASGRTVRSYGMAPTKFWINVADLPDGLYYLRVQSNLKTETAKFVLRHDN